MSKLYPIAKTLFEKCDQQNIKLLLAYPDFANEDLFMNKIDVVCNSTDVSKISQLIDEMSVKITCQYQQSDGYTIHFAQIIEGEITFFQISFINRLEIRGNPYLSVSEVISRRTFIDGLYYADQVDQLIFLTMNSLIKNNSTTEFLKYRSFYKKVLKNSLTSVQEGLENILGRNQALEVIGTILNESEINISLNQIFFKAWQNFGLLFFTNLIKWLFNELVCRLSTKNYKIVFLGVSNSITSSLISSLKEKMINSYPLIITQNFLPSWPWYGDRSSNLIPSNFFNIRNRNRFALSMIFISVFMRMWLNELLPAKKPTLYFYDGYIYDLYLDNKKNNFNRLKNTFIFSFLKFFPKPNICFYIDVPIAIAQTIDQGISYTDWAQKSTSYRQFAKYFSPTNIIRNDKTLTELTSEALHKILGSNIL